MGIQEGTSDPTLGIKELISGESDNTAYEFDGSNDFLWHYNTWWNPLGWRFLMKCLGTRIAHLAGKVLYRLKSI